MQIGSFKSTGAGYSGNIETLTLNALLTLEPVRSTSEKAPAFRVFKGVTEIGVAFKKTSEKGNEYLSCVIDDPSFAKPIYANLVIGESECSLLWNRQKPKAA